MDPVKGDDRGASPVIGVVLMVAVTIVLAAVVSFSVLGVGQTPSPAPNAKFSFDYDATGNLTITHSGGDELDGTNTLEVAIQYTNTTGSARTEAWSLPIDSQKSKTLTFAPKPDTEVKVVWTDPDGDVSQVIAEDLVP